jgi:hypothetical protein
MRTYYKPGSWNAICDVCGFKYKSHQLKMRWDGAMVCTQDWETRHPSDLIRVPSDDPSVPWSRPEAPDTFVTVGYDLLITDTGVFLITEDGDFLAWD